jgi:hypothetical protein
MLRDWFSCAPREGLTSLLLSGRSILYYRSQNNKHIFSCKAQRDSVRAPWNCQECGSDFVEPVTSPIQQTPSQQTPSNPFGNYSGPRMQQSQFRTNQHSAPQDFSQRTLSSLFENLPRLHQNHVNASHYPIQQVPARATSDERRYMDIHILLSNTGQIFDPGRKFKTAPKRYAKILLAAIWESIYGLRD